MGFASQLSGIPHEKDVSPTAALQISMRSEVARQIRQHARSSMKTEVCGVLIGRDRDGIVAVEACIPGINAAQAGAHVTFTQDTWEHIYKIKDRDYPDQRIVGWYHSHPGFGVFLSEHDQFIQQNFFSAPTQLAWVYDPHSDEEGCFGWHSGQIDRLSEVCMKDDGAAAAANQVGGGSAHTEVDLLPADPEPRPGWVDILFTVLSYTAIFALGVLLAFFCFPKERSSCR